VNQLGGFVLSRRKDGLRISTLCWTRCRRRPGFAGAFFAVGPDTGAFGFERIRLRVKSDLARSRRWRYSCSARALTRASLENSP